MRVSSLPFDDKSWDVPAWAAKRTYLVPEQSKLALRMDAFNGSRATSKDTKAYGLFSVAVQPDGTPGAVTQVRASHHVSCATAAACGSWP